MESIESILAVETFLKNAGQKNGNPETAAMLLSHAAVVAAAANEILHLRGLTSALPPELGNVHDLPPELLGELSIAKADELDDQLVTVINSYGGEASLDQILVGLYRKFKVSQKRRFLQNKLYRMEMIWSVGGKKGVYSTTPQENSEEKAKPESINAELGAGLDDDLAPF